MDFSNLDSLLEQYYADKNGPVGCVCGVMQNEKVIYERYLGYANKEKGLKMGSDSLFDMWSGTKVVICTAAMILYERGAFTLEEPYSKYFPEYEHMTVALPSQNTDWHVVPATRTLLIRDAFTMAAGYPYPMGASGHPTVTGMINIREQLTQNKGKYTLLDDIRAMAQVPAAFEPGTHWMYGFSHELVAGLIEICSGMTVYEFLKKEIFDPLGMNDTTYRFTGDQRERFCTYYQRLPDGAKVPIPGIFAKDHEPDAVYEAGGAGLISTLRDYLRFSQMLANGGELEGVHIIGRKTIDLMRRNHLNEEQMKDYLHNIPGGEFLPGYGYGLGVRTMIDPAKAYSNGSVGEFGWAGGSGTWILCDPEEKLSIIYMHQMSPNDEFFINTRVRNVVYGCID